MKEIRAKYLGTLQRWGETCIVELEVEGTGYAKAKGPVEEDELVCGLWYRFFGRWVHHYRYGDQFQFVNFVATQALDEDGMIRYMTRAPHVGRVTAKKLISLYGSDAVRVLRTEPARAAGEAKARGFTEEKAQEAAEFLAGQADLEDATIELLGLFASRGFPKKLPRKCINRWGSKAAKVVREDPYELLRFAGVGFLRADELYLALGHDPEAIQRQGLCAWYACASDNEGHTWLGAHAVISTMMGKIGATRVQPLAAVRWAIEYGILEHYQDVAGQRWLADHARSSAEAELAGYVACMGEYGPPDWPGVDGLEVSDHQRGELRRALTGRLALFGGSPGTGKTFSAARLISALIAEHGRDVVAVVAPTGKAAVRISEALSEYGIPLRACTVHSYLEVGKVDEEGGDGFEFRRGPNNPVEEKYIVCDESSMLDTWLLSKLLGAMRMDGHLLLVGDVNQLPPVGHGAPLRDLIRAGVPRGDLTEIRRNSGAIVSTCAAIRDESPWALPGTISLPEQNLAVLSTRSAADSVERIVWSVQRVGEGDLDAVWDVQVLVAVNERSPLSRKELNARLQAELNAANRPQREAAFWVNDKVVCLKNSWFPAVDELMDDCDEDDDVVVHEGDDGRPQIYVANGELGRVIEDHPTKTIVEFPAPKRIVLVPKGDDGTNRLDLGYALSCHKAQGSEWPVVIVALDDYGGAQLVCDRAWLYTAISRAKKACLLVGRERVAHDMADRVKIDSRKTLLVERVEEARTALAAKRTGIESGYEETTPSGPDTEREEAVA